VQVIDVDGKHKRGPSSASRPSGAGVWMAAE
jgi:hypothetical protein